MPRSRSFGTIRRWPPAVVIVDDHAGFRARATAMLEAAGYLVVGSCADGRSALSLLVTLRPIAPPRVRR